MSKGQEQFLPFLILISPTYQTTACIELATRHHQPDANTKDRDFESTSQRMRAMGRHPLQP
jgi:hypothetical protein